MAYKGHRPDLLIQVEKAIGRMDGPIRMYDEKWHSLKELADKIGACMEETRECVDHLVRRNHLEVKQEGRIVEFKVTLATMLMDDERPALTWKKKPERKCHKCGQPIKRRHSRKGAHPDHECKLTVIKGVMDQ